VFAHGMRIGSGWRGRCSGQRGGRCCGACSQVRRR
jgi:hypothetical protein